MHPENESDIERTCHRAGFTRRACTPASMTRMSYCSISSATLKKGSTPWPLGCSASTSKTSSGLAPDQEVYPNTKLYQPRNEASNCRQRNQDRRYAPPERALKIDTELLAVTWLVPPGITLGLGGTLNVTEELILEPPELRRVLPERPGVRDRLSAPIVLARLTMTIARYL